MRRLISLIVLSVAVVFASAPAQGSEYDLPRPTVSFNDDVRQVVYHGDVSYVGGPFTYAQDTAGDYHQRHHIAAVDTRDGELLSFSPHLDGMVRDLEINGDWLYIAGDFRRVNDNYLPKVARFSLSTGEVDTEWAPRPSARVFSVATNRDRVYLGGRFSYVGDYEQPALAAVRASDASIVKSFRPEVNDGSVRDMSVDHERLYIAGAFKAVEERESYRNFAAVDPFTGDLDNGFRAKTNVLIRQFIVEGDTIYAGLDGRGGELRAYDTFGRTLWNIGVDGGVQAVTKHGDHLIAGGHFDNVCTTNRSGPQGECVDGEKADRGKLLATDQYGNLLPWDPQGDSVVGVWSLKTHPDGTNFSAAGGFLTFGDGNMSQRGYALFD